MTVVKVRIAGCQLLVGMAKKPTDHRQGFLIHRGVAGKSVTQIMNAHFAEIGALNDRFP